MPKLRIQISKFQGASSELPPWTRHVECQNWAPGFQSVQLIQVSQFSSVQNSSNNSNNSIGQSLPMGDETVAVVITPESCDPVVPEPPSRFLLLDSRNISLVESLVLVTGKPTKHTRPLLFESEPWEQRFDNFYGIIIYDSQSQLYKCWYSPFTSSSAPQSSKGMSLEDRKQYKYRGGKGRIYLSC